MDTRTDGEVAIRAGRILNNLETTPTDEDLIWLRARIRKQELPRSYYSSERFHAWMRKWCTHIMAFCARVPYE